MIPSPKTVELTPNPLSQVQTQPALIEASPPPPPRPKQESEHLYLTGRPTLKDFLRYVRKHSINSPSDATLIDEWKAASECLCLLEKEEAGLADDPSIRKLGPEYEPLLIEFLKSPLVRHGFNTVPTEVALVELDHLVVYQKNIDLSFTRQIRSQLGATPTPQEIFHACLPAHRPAPPVTSSSPHSGKFVIASPSNDLRFLGTMTLNPEQIIDYPPPGNLACVLGLALGFGSNFLNAIYTEKRLILSNGSHRAYALREMGVTHAPCVIEHAGSRDELDIIAASDVREAPELYLKHPRPPMLRDYFNPKLRKIIPVHRRLLQLTVKFEIEESYLPAL